MNEYKNTKELIEYPVGGVLSKELIKTEKINITLFCMAKDTEISEHTSTKEGIVLILEGKGTFNLMGLDIAMLPGVIIYLEKNAVHSLKVDENTSFILSLHNN